MGEGADMMGMEMAISGWLAIGAAIFATGFWRVLGILLYHRISSDTLLMRLINMLAYSLLGAVMVLLMVNPTGLLATAALSHRMIGLLVGIGLLFTVKKLPIALIGAIGTFGFVTLVF